MSKSKLLIVESPTKAKTIKRFLDSNYTVSACVGHVRDLPESAKDIPEKYKNKTWKNLGVNIEDNFKPIYCIPKSKVKIIQSLKSQMKQASELILATDEDREGESISWHLQEVLKPKIPVKRIVFNEITKEAVHLALKNHRTIDKKLVQAQEARRVLDRLVGYSLSPLLWKKISIGLSAGRVQSVAVKLISEREIERMNFVISPYWSLSADLCPIKKTTSRLTCQLHSWSSKKIASGKDFDSKGKLKSKNLLCLDQKQTKEIIKSLKKTNWFVEKIEKKPISRSPKPPFITSTLQQVASRNLNFSPRQTMSLAQKLYEKGLITYMRTDSTNLSASALKEIRKTIALSYGKKELPEKARIYKTKSKAAQEAHEAIRPAGKSFTPPEKTGLTDQELKLYQLIWKRALACQMKNCKQELTSFQIRSGKALFFSSGTVILSPGFYQLYKDQEQTENRLPNLKKGESLKCLKLFDKEHQTQAPPRYNDASLIQKLETEGVGRPSTYAPTLAAIQERGYIKKINKTLAPTFTAIAVTKLLSQHLPDYVDLSFTSKMEKHLDEMALGKANYVKYLNHIYKGKKGLQKKVLKKEKEIDGSKSRTMHFDSFKDIDFHVGRFGAYITQKKGKKELKSSLPEDLFLSDLTRSVLKELLHTEKKKETAFTVEPKSKKKIFIKTGRFGPYLELEGGEKRVGIPKFLSVENLTVTQALQLLKLPEVLGQHPKTKKEVKKSIGRFGPYIVHDGDFRSIKADESFLSLSLKTALDILSKEKKGGRKRSSSKKTLKEFTHNKEKIQILEGYSPYIKFKNKNYSLPKGMDPLKIDLEKVLSVINKKTTTKKIKKVKKSLKKKNQ